uniref:Serpentine receptor class gamma n=1 Tax=Strongyloides venezuelensis TaxID=75913 RepID=A0A0K0G641_STRVS
MNDPATINTDDILLYKLQKYLPWFYVSIDTVSLIIHSIIAIFSYIFYGSIIVLLIKNRKNKLFGTFFYYCVILNGFVNIFFHLDNFFTSVLLSYEPFLEKVAPTEPNYWYAPLYYIGFFFTHFLYYNIFIISVNRMVMLTWPLKVNHIFENKKKLFTIFGILIAGIPHLYLLVTPAYFSISSSIYTNNKNVGKFINVMWNGVEELPLKITAINCGIFTIATFLVNLFNIYLLMKKGHKKIKVVVVVIVHYVNKNKQPQRTVHSSAVGESSLP